MLVKAFRNAYAYDAMSVAHKEKLIELVKLNPGLWKQSRKAPGLKQKIWDEIGIELGTTGYDARRQWEILRDQLRRENKRHKQNPNYKSKWMFYTKMLFMVQPTEPSTPAACSDDGEHYHHHHDQQIKQENSYNFTPKSEEPESIIQVRKDLQESNDSSNHVPSVDGYSPAPSLASLSARATTTTTTAVTETEAEETVDDYLPSTSAGVSSSTQIPRHNVEVDDLCERKPRNIRYSSGGYAEDEEDYHFAMSIVPSLRCIPRSKKLRLRSKILDLIATTLDDDYEEDTDMSYREDVKVNIELEDSKFIPDQMIQTLMHE